MTDMRAKILYSETPLTSYKREITNGIVNDIKSKIKDLKDKKNYEKNSNKSNELDFEINKDLLNKFKRNQGEQEKDNSVGINLKLDGVNSSKKLEFLINGNNLKKTSSNKERNGEKDNNNKTLLETLQNQFHILNNNKENSLCNLNIGIINQIEKTQKKVLSEKGNISNNPIRSFLNSNLEERGNLRINPEHKKNSIDLKKSNIVDLWNKDNNFIKDKHPNNISTHSNKSVDEKSKNQTRMKDKIKNFVFEIEGISAKANNHSVKEMPRQIKTNENLKYDFNTSKNFNHINGNSSYNGNKEFKLKNNSSSSNIFNLNGNNLRSPKTRDEKNTHSFNENKKQKVGEDDFFAMMVENKIESPANALKLKQDDIKNISTKLRFASTEEIRKLDENLIEELINLSSIINRLFEWRIKPKSFK